MISHANGHVMQGLQVLSSLDKGSTRYTANSMVSYGLITVTTCNITNIYFNIL